MGLGTEAGQAPLEGSRGTGQPCSAKLLSQFHSCDWAQAQVQLHTSVVKLQI